MIKGDLEIKGLDEALKNLKALADQYPQAAAAALYQEGLAIEAASVPLVPVDTGRLRATHYVSPPVDGGLGSPLVEVGYAADYALPVHERMDVSHKVGQAKFLETPMKAAVSGMTERLAARIRTNVEAKKGMPLLPTGSIDSARESARGAGAERHQKTMARRARKAQHKRDRKARAEATQTARDAFNLKGSKGSE